jgi:hypothetical protein
MVTQERLRELLHYNSAARRKYHGEFLPLAERIFLIILFGITPALSDTCLTRLEARHKWPNTHLFWHTDARCWDNRPKGADKYDERPQLKLVPPPVPNNVAGSPLEHASPTAPAATILYPEMVRGGDIAAYPFLVWRQPWLSPASIMEWPLLIDIDQKPFIAWNKRVE